MAPLWRLARDAIETIRFNWNIFETNQTTADAAAAAAAAAATGVTLEATGSQVTFAVSIHFLWSRLMIARFDIEN